jgi:hypothetical protein
MDDHDDRSGWSWFGGWTLLYAANLIVPLMFGSSITADGGRAGMWLVVATLWAAGFAAGYRWGEMRRALAVGGILAALTQIYPLPHMFAGLLALAAWRRLAGEAPNEYPHDTLHSDLGGFAVTLMSGGLAMVFAIMVGFLLISVRRGREAEPSPKGHADGLWDRQLDG